METPEEIAEYKREAAADNARLRAMEKELSRPLVELALVLKQLGANRAEVRVSGLPSSSYYGNAPINATVSLGDFFLNVRND